MNQTLDKKLKIAMLHWPVADFNLEQPGGVLRVGVEETKHLNRNGHQVHLYGIARKEYKPDTRNLREYSYLGKYRRYASLAEFFLRTLQYDILHGFNTYVVPRRAPQRALLYFQNNVSLANYDKAVVAYQRAHYLFNAQHMYDDFRKRYPAIPEDHCFVLHNGVDHNVFSPKTDKVLDSDTMVRIGYVGAWNQDKGIHVLTQIIHRLNQHDIGSKIQWEIAGGTGYWRLGHREAQSIEAQIEELTKIYNNVKVIGSLGHDKLADFLSALDIVVLPTQWKEPFGLTTIESMSCGTPVIVSAIGGAKEIISHGQDGFLIAKDDLGAFVEHIILLAEQPDLRQSLGKAARKTIEQRFTWDIHTRKLIEIYQLIEARRRRG